MSNYLKIIVNYDYIDFHYFTDGEIIFSHKNNFGLKHLEVGALSKEATSNLLDGLIYTLENISLQDRIPTDFRLVTPRYASWLKDAIEKKSYAQFFTDGIPVRVTIEDNQDNLINYAGHKKTTYSFKI